MTPRGVVLAAEYHIMNRGAFCVYAPTIHGLRELTLLGRLEASASDDHERRSLFRKRTMAQVSIARRIRHTHATIDKGARTCRVYTRLLEEGTRSLEVIHASPDSYCPNQTEDCSARTATALARAYEALGRREQAAASYRDLVRTGKAETELATWAKLELARFALEASKLARGDEAFQDLATIASSISDLAPFAIHLQAHFHHQLGEKLAAAAKIDELRKRLATAAVQHHAGNRLRKSVKLWPPTPE